jgi:hypothetical protein
MVLVQILSADELEDSISEVLEALVVTRRQVRAFVRKRAVGDGLEQKAWVTKMNSDFLLEQL